MSVLGGKTRLGQFSEEAMNDVVYQQKSQNLQSHKRANLVLYQRLRPDDDYYGSSERMNARTV